MDEESLYSHRARSGCRYVCLNEYTSDILYRNNNWRTPTFRAKVIHQSKDSAFHLLEVAIKLSVMLPNKNEIDYSEKSTY
jgi:hypothetical protein